MDRKNCFIEHKLVWAFMHLRRMGWHHALVAGRKPSEIRVLFCIKRGMGQSYPGMKVSEISKWLHVTSPTITQLLKGLEADGLIERNIDEGDRRAVGVKLTRQGEQVIQQAIDDFTSSMRGLIEYLGEEESNQLAELLFKSFRYFQEKEADMSYPLWNGDGQV